VPVKGKVCHPSASGKPTIRMEVEFQDEVAQVPRILSDGDNTVDNVYRFYGEMATFALLLLLGLLTNGPLLVIYFRSKHIRSVVVDK